MATSLSDCICCEMCNEVCPSGAITLAFVEVGNYSSQKGTIIREEYCTCCFNCKDACPVSCFEFHLFTCGGMREERYGGSGSGGGVYYGDEGGGGSWGTNTSKQKTTEQRVKELIPILTKALNEKFGINLSSIKVYHEGEDCFVSARVINNHIEICDNFLNYEQKDQVSILWHEAFHINNDKIWSPRLVRFAQPVYIENVPEGIKDYINNVLGNELADLPYAQQLAYDQEISLIAILEPTYYQNEIAAYEAEISTVKDVSPKYDAERKYMLWKNRESLEISQKYYGK